VRDPYKPGSVFQINETHLRPGWIGCFVLATDIKSWGIQGVVSHPGETHQDRAEYPIRLNWSEIDYIGEAKLVPQEMV